MILRNIWQCLFDRRESQREKYNAISVHKSAFSQSSIRKLMMVRLHPLQEAQKTWYVLFLLLIFVRMSMDLIERAHSMLFLFIPGLVNIYILRIVPDQIFT
jgi:hypothetical protein